MLIARGETIAGEDAIELRALLRRLIETSFTRAGLARFLDMSDREANRLFDLLLSEGFIEVEPEQERGARVLLGDNERYSHADDLWRTTVAGNALAKARIGKRMPRAEATKMLAGVIARAEAINADSTALFNVDTIELFGSLARPGAEPVGDIDLRAVVTRRLPPEDYMAELGRRWPGPWLTAAFAATREVHGFLTGGSPRIDLQLDETAPTDVPLDTPPIAVYSRSQGTGNTA